MTNGIKRKPLVVDKFHLFGPYLAVMESNSNQHQKLKPLILFFIWQKVQSEDMKWKIFISGISYLPRFEPRVCMLSNFDFAF